MRVTGALKQYVYSMRFSCFDMNTTLQQKESTPFGILFCFLLQMLLICLEFFLL